MLDSDELAVFLKKADRDYTWNNWALKRGILFNSVAHNNFLVWFLGIDPDSQNDFVEYINGV